MSHSWHVSRLGYDIMLGSRSNRGTMFIFICICIPSIYNCCSLNINTPPNAGILCCHHHFQNRKQKKRHLAMLNHKCIQIVKTNVSNLGLLQRLSIQDHTDFSERGVDMCVPPPRQRVQVREARIFPKWQLTGLQKEAIQLSNNGGK